MSRPGLLLLLGAGGIVAIVAACLLGSVSMPPGRLVAALAGRGDPADILVVWSVRLPRALAAFLVGLALGVAGAALQGLLRNPLAEPGVLGVSATAALAGSVGLHFGLVATSAVGLPLLAVGGALVATLLLAVAAARGASTLGLLLIGVGLSSFAGALMALLLNLAPNPFSLADLVNWSLGTVANRGLPDLALAAPFLGAGLLLLLASGRGLSALTLGEEAAQGIGLDVGRLRLMVVVGTGLVTGAAVSLAGAIGFVGLIAPHLIRPLVQHDPAASLLPSGLLAGFILVVADISVRVAPTSSELKLGVVAALLGAPLFVAIALRRAS